jgi:hypothetical protein
MNRKPIATAVALAFSPAFLHAGATPGKNHEPLVRIAKAEVTVFGTVTAIEKDEVAAKPEAPAFAEIRWTVAVVKIDRAVVGAENTTHLRVGFVTPPPDPETPWPTLKKGQRVCLFLQRHRTEPFYQAAWLSPWLDLEAKDDKENLELVEKALPVVADPAKALRAEKAEDRFRAAAFLALRYRTPPHPLTYERECDTVEIPREESQLILKALGEVSWDKPIDGVAPGYAVNGLGVKKGDGFRHDLPVTIHLMKATHPNGWADVRDDFNRWLGKRGADYRIKKLVPKPGK